eukprot:EG_transcript_22357
MEPSIGTRLRVWWGDFPLCCRAMFSVAVLVYVLQCVGIANSSHWCFNARMVYERLQVYRVFTVAYFHGGLLHIILNLMAMVSLGPWLERHFGTANFLGLVLALQALAGVMEVTVARVLRLGPTVPAALYGLFPWNGCSIGMSGLLFAWITMHCQKEGAARSLFGFCNVPARLYPWALLLLIYLLWPGSSLAGHLFGILAGYCAPFVVGGLERLALDSFVPSVVKRLPAYKAATGGLILSGVLYNPNATTAGGSSWLPRFWRSSGSGQFPGQGRVL